MLIKQGDRNPTLKGHKVLFLTQLPLDKNFKDRLWKQFPDLKISYHDLPWGVPKPGDGFPEEEWKDTTIIVTGSALPDKGQAPKLEYVQLVSAGANHILQHPLFTDTDIKFATANGVHGPQISEWIIATFLAFQHRIPQYLDLQRQGTWKRIETPPIEDAVNKRVGILGYGSIGRQTARVALALGLDVHAYTLHPRTSPESRRDDSYTPPGLGDPEGKFPAKWFSGGTTEELHAFLGSDLDLLVVALPLTEKTKGLISAPEFKVLSKKKTFVANIARGPIIDTSDLIDALDKELIRGAALDVTDPEPLPDGHPLWKAKNLILTPHVSGQSTAYGDRVLAILELNLKRLSEGRELTNVVSRREGYGGFRPRSER